MWQKILSTKRFSWAKRDEINIISSKWKIFQLSQLEHTTELNGEQRIFYAQREWALVIRQIGSTKPEHFHRRKNKCKERDCVMILNKKNNQMAKENFLG